MPGAEDLELAWAAGFFDGEGCVTLSPERRNEPWRYLHISAAQVDRRVLDRMKAAVGGRVSGPFKNRPANHQPFYMWQAYGRAAWEIAERLLPYLSERNRDRLEDARQRQVVGSRSKNECIRGHPLEGENLCSYRKTKNGGPNRQCRECIRRRARESYARQKERSLGRG